MSSSSQFRSVLDSGVRDRSPKVAVDRITRRRSPSRHREDDEVEVVVPRVSQPYRTSLSAVAAPLRVKKSARSRSVSPGGSLISGRSRSKSPGNRRSSPKHVTYDERVTVRHSDTEDSLVADLSGKESSLEGSPCDMTDNQSPREVSSGHGSSPEAVVPVLSEQERHAAELRQTCHEITDWYSRTPSQSGSSPASTMDRLQVEPPLYISHSPDQSSADFFTSSPGRGDSGVYTDGEVSAKRGKVNIEKDYNHDRTISYRLAIKAHYSDEVKRLAAANIEEICPQRSAVDGKIMPSPVSPSSEVCPRTERSNTLPSKTVTGSDRDLHGSKKSVSASIGNFFRKISPRMSRREKHGRSSSSGSAQSLDTSTGGSHESNQSLDRSRGSRARRSFLRMIGRSRSRSQSKSSDPEEEKRLSVPHKNTEIQGHSELDGVNQALPDSTHRILKSIEQNKVSDKSVYQRFKEKQAHAKTTDKTLQPKSQAMKASPDTSPGSADTGRSTSQPNKENEVTLTQRSPVAVHQGTAKASPPQTLNVRSSQKPLMKNASVASGDESIGDCSLDVNLEGSEPTLLNTSQPSVSASRQVILSQDNVLCPSLTSPSVCCPLDPGARQAPRNTDMQLSQPPPVVTLENGGLSKQTSVASTMPRLSNSCDISPRDTSKVPSHLKLSCAVSGYGRYSSYSSRKDINLSSPGTSASSLRSDGSSSDSLPGRSQPVNRTASLPLNFTKNHLSEVKSIGHVNGQIGDITCISNGHSAGIYPTGDAVKDGQYYLDLCQTEEERLLVLCGRAKGDMGETTLPEEANGRIRAAIGKTNLLITKKFKQFRGLCHKHMKPEGADRPTKWEDLQGFWDMVKIQIDDLDELFAEIAFMRQNEWKDVPRKLQSARSSANSSPKSPSLSLSSTPSQTPGHTPGHTPASRRKPVNLKDTPDSSPEKSVKSKQTAKAREDARKRMLAEKRAAMKLQKLKAQEQNNSQEVEIYLPDLVKK